MGCSGGSRRRRVCLRRLPRGELLGLRGATLEALDATTRVDQLLLAGVEGVTLRAELDAQRRDRRPRRELVPARAVDLALDVVGVDLGLHDDSSVPAKAADANSKERPKSGSDSQSARVP